MWTTHKYRNAKISWLEQVQCSMSVCWKHVVTQIHIKTVGCNYLTVAQGKWPRWTSKFEPMSKFSPWIVKLVPPLLGPTSGLKENILAFWKTKRLSLKKVIHMLHDRHDDTCTNHCHMLNTFYKLKVATHDEVFYNKRFFF